jgi:beta-galactosidase beta subunit
MQEEVKAVRTIKEFIAWYEAKEKLNTEQSLQGDLELHKFYIKFKYILEQENEENRKMGDFLG